MGLLIAFAINALFKITLTIQQADVYKSTPRSLAALQ